MNRIKLTLTVLDGKFAICRLDSSAEVPGWAWEGPFVSVTRTADELSVVCAEASTPLGARCEDGWRCLKVQGPFDLDMTGLLSTLTAPLAAAGVGVFAISTFDTDYLLVKESNLQGATSALLSGGHQIEIR